MTSQTPNPSSTNASRSIDCPANLADRCQHLTARRRQCRGRAVRSGLCFRHAALQIQPVQPIDVDLSADFLIQLDDFQSADQINQFLAKLLILVVQNRISPRRAAVLTYITNQLLHSLTAMQREQANEGTKIIFDMPGPERDKVDSDSGKPS